MHWAIRSALSVISTRLKQAVMGIISVPKTIGNQCIAIASHTAEVRKDRNITPPRPPAPSQTPQTPKLKENADIPKGKGTATQFDADITINAPTNPDSRFTRVQKKTKPAPLVAHEYTRMNREVIVEIEGPLPKLFSDDDISDTITRR
ncbi:hypothetical protein Q9L58_010307 [Maublancomyces gigas]|uniref:Uncharacterized protein n=1 Tax=Discina gigas TaxID=1032678 RepID=A0ABR3G4I2_9PEZI